MVKENLVPDDEPKSTIPDAVIAIEEQKPDAEKPATEPPKDAAQEGVEALAKNLEAEKKRRAAAEQKAAVSETARIEAEKKAETAQSRISTEVQKNIDANRTAAQNHIEAAKAKRDQAKKEYIALQAEGKFDEAFEATQVAAQASADIKGAESYLTQLDENVARLEADAKQPKPEATKDDGGRVDPITGIKFTPSTYEWVDKHKSQWADQDFRIECDAAARQAKKKGLDVDTPEYFEFIEQRLQREGYLEMPTAQEEPEAKPDPKPKPETPKEAKKPSAASVGAAPSRAVPGSSGVPKGGVKLSGMEREIARSLVESLPDVYGKDANADQIYAKQKLALQQEDE